MAWFVATLLPVRRCSLACCRLLADTMLDYITPGKVPDPPPLTGPFSGEIQDGDCRFMRT